MTITDEDPLASPWLFVSGLLATVATYITFEIFPSFYGIRVVPFACILGYWILFEFASRRIRKYLRR
jgi:hypothetical protein